MSSYDIRSDSPGLLRVESLNVTLKFERLSDTTGRVSWNIPSPATGCLAGTQAYNGIVIVLDKSQYTNSRIPKNGVIYSDDPTADENLFAGDKIGTSLVVGAFYNDKETTFVDIQDLDPSTAYFISGFPVDKELRYFVEGVHSYSQDVRRPPSNVKPSQHTLFLKKSDGTEGVELTDLTGLDPTETYTFPLSLGGITPQPRNPLPPQACGYDTNTWEISILGANATTYGDLINEINKQFALIKGCPQGAQPPNAGSYVYEPTTKTLLLWNGSTHVPLPVVVQTVSPDTVVDGDFWWNDSTSVMNYRDTGAWVTRSYIEQMFDPTKPKADETYWFDGSEVHKWNGVTWCDVVSYSSETDPSLETVAPDGSFWNKPSTGAVYKWDASMQLWITITDMVVRSAEDPNSLTPGTYWFDTETNVVNILLPTSDWQEVVARILENPPAFPALGTVWLNPLTEEVKVWDGLNWDLRSIIVNKNDPKTVISCSIWWDTVNDVLNVWNRLTSAWVASSNFYIQETDPTSPPPICDGVVWFNPSTNEMRVRFSDCWKLVSFISYATDPTTSFPVGMLWKKETQFFEWDGALWNQIMYLASFSDPTVPTIGTFWFSLTDSSLYSWNGISWVAIVYVTTRFKPQVGSCWYDSVNNIPKQWNGVAWIETTGLAKVELNCNGYLVFTDLMFSGSESYIAVDGRVVNKSYPGYTGTPVSVSGTIWMALADVTVRFANPTPGDDGDDGTPMYEKLGVGTDGSIEERLSIAKDIRYSLGYPNVDVELTQEQLDLCITRALEELRARSSAPYKRSFFFLAVGDNVQRYKLNARSQNFDKIVSVLGVYRTTSSFLSSAHGSGVYGQIVLQHLYHMGTFDLLSYHMISDYVKNMEQLFAAKVTFTWNEQTRELYLHKRFPFREKYVLIEASIERTEQDLLVDRNTKPWLRRFATAQARLMLAESRGKFATLAGPNGGTSLNASDLRMAAQEEMQQCYDDIENYLIENLEEWGPGQAITIG